MRIRFWCELLNSSTVVVEILFSDDDMNGLVLAIELGF